MLSRRLFTAGMAAVASGICVGRAEAMQVSPMVTQITPSGPGASYRLAVRNDSATPITVEILCFKLAVDDQGMQTTTEDEGDLIAFPPQSLIPPGREQLVNMRYVGDAQIAEPRMYLVRAAQLPVALGDDPSENTAQVKVAFNVNTHVFVSPPDAEPEVRVSSVQRDANGDALISVHNDGTGVARLRRAQYVLTDASGKEVEVEASEVQLGQVSALPAKRTRELRIPAAAIAALSGPLTAVIRLE